MTNMEIVIKGRVPSKKNSRITTRTGRSFPSAAYTAWHKDASYQLKGKPKIDSDHLSLHFFMPDNRHADLTNKAESIMDLLVDNGLLRDDSWQVIKCLTLFCEGIDKNNPRCEIIW